MTDTEHGGNHYSAAAQIAVNSRYDKDLAAGQIFAILALVDAVNSLTEVLVHR
jgi:hypothetical protein